jgi:hypothetical protein
VFSNWQHFIFVSDLYFTFLKRFPLTTKAGRCQWRNQIPFFGAADVSVPEVRWPSVRPTNLNSAQTFSPVVATQIKISTPAHDFTEHEIVDENAPRKTLQNLTV